MVGHVHVSVVRHNTVGCHIGPLQSLLVLDARKSRRQTALSLFLRRELAGNTLEGQVNCEIACIHDNH